MEVFQTIGIFVVALVFYAIVSLFIPITINDGNASKGFWIAAWVIGAILFCTHICLWINGWKLI